MKKETSVMRMNNRKRGIDEVVKKNGLPEGMILDCSLKYENGKNMQIGQGK